MHFSVHLFYLCLSSFLFLYPQLGQRYGIKSEVAIFLYTVKQMSNIMLPCSSLPCLCTLISKAWKKTWFLEANVPWNHKKAQGTKAIKRVQAMASVASVKFEAWLYPSKIIMWTQIIILTSLDTKLYFVAHLLKNSLNDSGTVIY